MNVRFAKSGCQEKGLITRCRLFHKLDRPARHNAVPGLIIRNSQCSPLRTGTCDIRPSQFDGFGVDLFDFFQFIFRNVPARTVVKIEIHRRFSSPLGDVKNLSDSGCKIPLLSKMLRQENHIVQGLARIGHLIQHSGSFGPAPTEKRRPRWVAQGKLAVGTVKFHAALRQTFEVRRLHLRVLIDRQAIVEIVHHDQEHIHLPRWARRAQWPRRQTHRRHQNYRYHQDIRNYY
ncbi:MAG: hypothetical protein IPL01_21560 [Acidobacteria bacterium]|nr:hypothetical protein [Acidobacteriota bacterium]